MEKMVKRETKQDTLLDVITTTCWHALLEWTKEGRLEGVTEHEFIGFPSKLDELLAHACGYRDVDDMALNFRDETRQTMELLGGPNGWTIYKTLLAKRSEPVTGQ